MTKERAVRRWTDYPIIEPGDRPGRIAHVRLVDVLSFDRDKYRRIRVGSVVDLVSAVIRIGLGDDVARRLDRATVSSRSLGSHGMETTRRD